MKKITMTLGAVVLSVSVFAASVMAAPPTDKENKGNSQSQPAIQSESTGKGNGNGQAGKSDGDTVTSVTYATYGHNGYKGLQKAYENVKDKPAGQIIANLLESKYGIDVNADEVLSEAADQLAAEGNVEDAVEVQKEAVKANTKNINSYKKLGKLVEKLGKTGVKAYVNGVEPKFEDMEPVIKEGNTLVPIRAIAEALNAEVIWNDEEKSVTITKDGIVVKLVLGDVKAYVNGEEVILEVPGERMNGRTMVPVRFISEALKAIVDWEPETTSVIINS
jgi:tetratricopeptide (TPR) repeat protein